MEFDIGDFTENASPLGQYIADLERPGGIIDRNIHRVAEAIVEATEIQVEREELQDLVEVYGNLHAAYGRFTSEIACIESVRDIYDDQSLLDEVYRETVARADEMSGTDEDDNWVGTLATAWHAIWDCLVRVTGDTPDDKGFYAVASIYTQAIEDYATSRERHGHNLAALAFFDGMRAARD